MRDFISWFWEQKYILMVLLFPCICYVWYKLKYRKLRALAKPFLIIGIVLTALGVFLSNLTFSTQNTIQFLLLKEMEVAGKFIPIGYSFILIAIIFFLDAFFEKAFKLKEKNKT